MAIRKALAYSKRRITSYTRKSRKVKNLNYIKAVPNQKVTKFNMGQIKRFEDGDYKNTIKIVSPSREGALLMRDTQNILSKTDPNSEGFLGYQKLLWQVVPLGTKSSVNKYTENLTATYKPPEIIRFESYGLPIRAADVIEVLGQLFFVTKVDSEVDPTVNRWWQTIEAEWYTPSKTFLDFKDQEDNS